MSSPYTYVSDTIFENLEKRHVDLSGTLPLPAEHIPWLSPFSSRILAVPKPLKELELLAGVRLVPAARLPSLKDYLDECTGTWVLTCISKVHGTFVGYADGKNYKSMTFPRPGSEVQNLKDLGITEMLTEIDPKYW